MAEPSTEDGDKSLLFNLAGRLGPPRGTCQGRCCMRWKETPLPVVTGFKAAELLETPWIHIPEFRAAFDR